MRAAKTTTTTETRNLPPGEPLKSASFTVLPDTTSGSCDRAQRCWVRGAIAHWRGVQQPPLQCCRLVPLDFFFPRTSNAGASSPMGRSTLSVLALLTCELRCEATDRQGGRATTIGAVPNAQRRLAAACRATRMLVAALLMRDRFRGFKGGGGPTLTKRACSAMRLHGRLPSCF